MSNASARRRGLSAAPRTVAASTVAATAVAGADLELVRERTRGRIALALIALLSALVLPGMAGLLFGRLSVNDLKELLASLGVLTTLVGTAMGFYFGRITK
jgi:membrane protein YqaA with SNARE-associated domain